MSGSKNKSGRKPRASSTAKNRPSKASPPSGNPGSKLNTHANDKTNDKSDAGPNANTNAGPNALVEGHQSTDTKANATTLTSSIGVEAPNHMKLSMQIKHIVGPGTKVYMVTKRTVTGVWNDGFIHAGNLAYMAIFALFPLFILGAAVFNAMGDYDDQSAMIDAVVTALPPVVGNVIEPVARDVISARSGWVLWLGGIAGLWTTASLVETIRDILRRAYGAQARLAFWRYRLLSIGIILGAVILLILSLYSQVILASSEAIITSYFPALQGAISSLTFSRIFSALGLYISIFMLFITLTPSAFRGRKYPKWPGSLLVTGWWISVTLILPGVLQRFSTWDLTYGSMAGIMVVLFFFWLIGLGVVVGAELNAVLAGEGGNDDCELLDDGLAD